MMSCLARAMPSTTGSTVSRWEGLAASETLICSPSRPVKVPSAPRWYFTSPEPCIDFGSRLPSNSRKICAYDLPTMFARTFSRPRWAMPMTTSSRRDSAARVEHGVEQRDDGLAALQREALLADVLRLQEGLERLGGVQPAQDAQLLLALRLGVRALDAVLDPLALLRVLDVHELDAGGAAVRVAQHAEDVAQLHHGLAGEAADRELALQVPQGEPVLDDVEVGVLALAVLQRVGVGHDVAADPVGVDQLEDAGGLGDVVVVADVDVLEPADRLVGDAQRLEDLVVEAVLAEQQLVDDPQELAGGGALDDPVVVGRRSAS